MSEPAYTGSRLRAYLEFLAAILYFFLARSLAHHGAQGLAGDAWSPLVEQAMLVFLLLLGYAAMGFWLDRQADPISAQGLPRRTGWFREAGLGLATGWAVALVCVLPMTIIGGIAISVSTQGSAWGWLVADAAFFALAAWPRRSPFAAMRSRALCAQSGRREPRWDLRPSTPSCRRSRRARTTPASPSPSHSPFCSPRLICARAPCG